MQPITMTLPLRGEWMTPNTPGSRVPSHGTDLFGARYAYDFIQVDWTRRGLPAYRGSLARYLFRGVAVEDYYCWDAPVYAPCDGVVVVAKDGWLERPRTNLRADVRNAYRNATRFNPRCDDVRMITGNYAIIQYAERVFAALCHLRMGSVAVASVLFKISRRIFLQNCCKISHKMIDEWRAPCYNKYRCSATNGAHGDIAKW